MAEILHRFWLEGISPTPWILKLEAFKFRKQSQSWMAEILHRPRCHPNIEILQGEASKVLSCNTWLAVQDFSHQQYSNRLVALHPWSGWSFFEETLPVQIEYTLLEFFPVFFQLHILVCSFLQLHSSCKFQLQILFTLGEAFADAKTKQTDPN